MSDINETNVVIPLEKSEEEKKRDKRNRMCNEILEIETKNINKTNKDSDAEMGRKIVGIIERLA